MTNQKLKELFSPQSVAVIGASNGFDKLGYHVMKSLVEGEYHGRIFPVNPKSDTVWDMRSYPSLAAIEGAVDLAVVVVPAAFVPAVLHECGRQGVKGIVMITAGFREIEDAKGEVLEKEIGKIAGHYGMPIIGPNTFGIVNRTFGINASFTPEFSRLEKGGVALISQSGGICHLCGFLAIEQRLGISKLMSLGNRLNVGFPEVVRYLIEEDEATRVIALYIEGLDEPRSLLQLAQAARGKKPIIAYKSGKSERGNSASRFHTGSLAGNHQIWRGALRQAGILEVMSAEELVDTAKVLDACAPLKGNRVAVLSGQAGPGMVAADAAEGAGLKLCRFTPATQAGIDELLPPLAIRTNPVDMGPTWFDTENILRILKVVLQDEGTDGVIFLTVFASANVKMARQMQKYMADLSPFAKPVIACFSAPPGIWDEELKELDGNKGMVILPTPERAAKAMGNLWKANLLMNGHGR